MANAWSPPPLTYLREMRTRRQSVTAAGFLRGHMRQLNIIMPSDAHSRFKVYAAVHNATMGALVLQFARALGGDPDAIDAIVRRLIEADRRLSAVTRVGAGQISNAEARETAREAFQTLGQCVF